jgi:hypothetical protein
MMGSWLLGYMQEPFAGEGEPVSLPADRSRRAVPAGEIPYLAEMHVQVRHDDEVVFRFGLDLILDGLERLREAE